MKYNSKLKFQNSFMIILKLIFSFNFYFKNTFNIRKYNKYLHLKKKSVYNIMSTFFNLYHKSRIIHSIYSSCNYIIFELIFE